MQGVALELMYFCDGERSDSVRLSIEIPRVMAVRSLSHVRSRALFLVS